MNNGKILLLMKQAVDARTQMKILRIFARNAGCRNPLIMFAES